MVGHGGPRKAMCRQSAETKALNCNKFINQPDIASVGGEREEHPVRHATAIKRNEM
jgi:hypothetical protein